MKGAALPIETAQASVTVLAVDMATGVTHDSLRRTLRKRHVEMIAIGGIIGAGLFVGSSASIAQIGPAVVLSYAAAGLIVLLVMRMLGEMAMAIPGVQSFPDFARIGLGRWAGFMSGWLYWYFWVVLVAIEAMAGARIVHLWMPALEIWQIGMALTAVLTGVNLLSTRSYGEIEFWLSSIKVAAILAFIVVVASYVSGLSSPSGPTIANLTAHGGFMPNGPLSVLAGVTSVIFALVGAEIATIAAAESAESQATIARMTTSVAARILIFYVLSILLVVAAVPWTVIQPGVSPFAVVLARIGIPGGALIMNIIVLVAVLSCLNSGIYVTSRVLYGLAAQGDAPRALANAGAAGIPRRAILIGSLFSFVALATAIVSPDGAFAFLVNASGTIMLFLYLLLAISQLLLRNRLEQQSPDRLAIRMWLHPWGSLATITAIVGVLVAMAVTPALASQFLASLVAIAIAGGAFLLVRKRTYDAPHT
jgi:L-asparagine transporter-like permease